MKYLELFSGSGIGSFAIQSIFPNAKCVGHSEIDKHAIKVYDSNFQGHLNFGDIKKIDLKLLPDFDLLIAGSPCQDLSIMRKEREGIIGDKSSLFFHLVDILQEKKPKYFILENVASMARVDQEIITRTLKNIYGKSIVKTRINSQDFTAQKRIRLYWTNFVVSVPDKKKVTNPNIIAYSKSGRDPNDRADKKPLPHWQSKVINGEKRYFETRLRDDGIANTCTTGKGCNSNLSKNFFKTDYGHRLLTAEECEELQGWPSGWTKEAILNQRYKIIGNGFNYPVIRHILKSLKSDLLKANSPIN